MSRAWVYSYFEKLPFLLRKIKKPFFYDHILFKQTRSEVQHQEKRIVHDPLNLNIAQSSNSQEKKIIHDPLNLNIAKSSHSQKAFKPFENNPEKMKSYENYLKFREKGMQG